jgi:hypothetical protein
MLIKSTPNSISFNNTIQYPHTHSFINFFVNKYQRATKRTHLSWLRKKKHLFIKQMRCCNIIINIIIIIIIIAIFIVVRLIFITSLSVIRSGSNCNFKDERYEKLNKYFFNKFECKFLFISFYVKVHQSGMLT